MRPAPPPREPGTYVVETVCLGNICRSPTAAVVLRDRLASAGLDDRVEVVSSGTGGWHVGEPMDHRAAATLRAAGYDAGDVDAHRGRQLGTGPEAERGADLVLAMDAVNLSGVRDGRAGTEGHDDRVALFRDFDPEEPGADVPDPYYGGEDGFREVLAMVERTADALVASIDAALQAGSGPSPEPGPAATGTRAPEDRPGAAR
ncbi:low molecular weight protein-tyrosine-phosphatase [Nocardioides sp. CFH 31398]|uniref:low molecular weight protein-tyrosine-phosphatase n=1 Tax=Nocardioides sp. CFH 31398 TaxID=2919579 RepID=UPI001F0619D0|nr:low molecular weight protein-tyrosine-phosphatase [Nocardioides sp. CFH 31398]MCH1864900.1 low molecular weight phosphotyrosine protein phosphatase [Nocardioides sp. CFH 31398]